MFRNNLSVPSSRAKTPKESLLSQYRIYLGKMVGGETSRCSVVSASMVDASVWERVEYGSQCSYGERRSVIGEIVTGVMTRHWRTVT